MQNNPLDLDKSKSCIVVGNGPSLIFQKKGKIIDSFEEIFRFNKFAIKGYEQFVGSKTTVWCTHGKDQLPTDDDIRPDKVLYIHGERGNVLYNPQKIWRIPLSFYYKVRDEIKNETTEKEKSDKLLPSTGILVILWLLENVYENLYIAGFDNFSKTLSKQHHYWVKKEYTKPFEHDGEWEKLKIHSLYKEKKLKFL